MIVVMQCAGTKQPDAGFLKTQNGRKVLFVADPGTAPPGAFLYARPDDPSDTGPTWRDVLIRYNQSGEGNPLGLARAFELYINPVYRRLAEHAGMGNLYILSAGWGLIASSFLTPKYDITFSAIVKKKAPYKLRRKKDRYADLCMLPPETDQPIVFFGSKDYAPLFASLTANMRVPKTVFYNSAQTPRLPGCVSVRFPATSNRNWQYECANAFLEGQLTVPFETPG